MIKEQENTQKINKGCLNRQPFSFTTFSNAFIYSRTLLPKPCSHSIIIASCFINQNENLEKLPVNPISIQPKIITYQPAENHGIILCRLLVSI
jgi:hypothetical protein